MGWGSREIRGRSGASLCHCKTSSTDSHSHNRSNRLERKCRSGNWWSERPDAKWFRHNTEVHHPGTEGFPPRSRHRTPPRLWSLCFSRSSRCSIEGSCHSSASSPPARTERCTEQSSNRPRRRRKEPRPTSQEKAQEIESSLVFLSDSFRPTSRRGPKSLILRQVSAETVRFGSQKFLEN